MLIQIIGVGKLKEKYLIDGIAEYAKRLTPYLKFQVIEVADEKAPDSLSEAEVVQVKGREGERILAQIKSEAHVIALAIDGKLWSSEELAAELTYWHLRDEPCRVRHRREPRALRRGHAPRAAAHELRAHDAASSAHAPGAGGAGVSRGEDQSGEPYHK